MKYLAIEFLGQNEISGCRFVYDDWKLKEPISEFNFNDENDPSRLCRTLFYHLQDLKFPMNDKTGRVIVDVAFCIFDLRLLQHMASINNYIEMRMFNPLILYYKDNRIPMLRDLTKKQGVYGIVDIIRGHFNDH